MSIQSKAFSIKQKILHVVQSAEPENSDWSLAQYLLLHYNELDSLRLTDAAEQCHVSPSTVRRFCQKLGYDNFTDLQLARMNNPEDQYEIAVSNYKNKRYAPRALYDEVSKNLWTIGQKLDRQKLEHLAKIFYTAECVIFLAVRPYNFVLQEFQSQFTALNKPLYIFDDLATRLAAIEQLGTNRVFVSLTMSGGLVPAIDQDLIECEGTKILITSPAIYGNTEAKNCLSHYDLVYPLPSRLVEYNYQEIYGKYIVSYFFDLLMGELVKLALGL